MRMLAEKLGVTKTTVSLALRGHHSVSANTCKRVHELAQEMGYRPDPAIAAIAAQRWSSGASKRHRVIAFLCHHVPHAKMIQAAYLPGARLRAEELGFKLEPFFVDDYPSAEAVGRVLFARGIRGIIVPSIANPASKRIMQLDWSKFTAVCCGVGRVRPMLHTVSSDLIVTTRLVWEVLAELGFRRIGAALHCHTPVADEDWQRLGASHAAIRLLGLHEAAEIPFLNAQLHDDESLYQWYLHYKPEVIVAFNDAVGWALERKGVKIPEEVQLVTLSSPAGSKWSGVIHHVDKIARTSIDVLNDELRDNRWGLPELAKIILISPEWNSGTSFLHDDFASRYTIKTSRPDITLEPIEQEINHVPQEDPMKMQISSVMKSMIAEVRPH